MSQCGAHKLGLPDSRAELVEPHHLPASLRLCLTTKLSLEAWLQLEFSTTVKQSLRALFMHRTRQRERTEKVKTLPCAPTSSLPPHPHGQTWCLQRKSTFNFQRIDRQLPPQLRPLCVAIQRQIHANMSWHSVLVT